MKRTKKILAFILSACMILTMFPMLAFADESTVSTDPLPESEHDYANSYDNTWIYLMECAHNGLYVTFDEQTETESNYDYIYILDGNDEQIGKYSGNKLAGKTIYVPTPSFKIRLTSDRSGTKWGFKVTGVQMVDEYIDLSKVGSVEDISPVFVNEDVNPVVQVNQQTLEKDKDYEVSAVTDSLGEKTATITGKGSYTGTLEKSFRVVDEDNLAEGASVVESNIQLRQGSDIGSSYVLFSDVSAAWTSAIESMTLTPVEMDGVTRTDPGSAVYPKAPKEITLTSDQLSIDGNRVSFKRTADNPVVYVPEGKNPIQINGRWSTNTYPQSQKYHVTVKARGYQDTTGTTIYYTGTSPEFSIIIDADGDTSTIDDRTIAKSWTSSEISEMSEFANGSSQCGMTGFRTFSGEGVSLKTLLEKANVPVSDSDYFLLDTSDHYGNYFTYDSLFGNKRYFMRSIYEDGFASYYNELASSDNESGSIVELRRYLASHVTDEDIIEPRINKNYVESVITGNELADAVLPTASNQNYNSLIAYENQYRFFYGIALVQEDCTVTFDSQGGSETDAQTVKSHPMTGTENTTMKSSYWANSLVIFRNAGESHKTEPSTAADKIIRPADPTRVGYTFGGWYTDENCTEGNEFDFSANDGTVDQNTTLYAKWIEGNTLPESDHEYASNTDRTWSYDYGEGADNGIVVKFNEETSTEKGYDTITILDGNGNELGKYSGKELSGKSVYVPTSKVQIRLTSDRSTNDYGFKVESIEPNGETIDLGQFGKIDKIDAVEVNGQPVITVTVNGETLTEGTDYTVSSDTSTAGIKTATITGTGKYSGTLSKDFMVYNKAIKITDFDITSKEHDDADKELNQTIIATITFDSDVKMTEDDLKDDLVMTIAGGDVSSTARDVSYQVEGNKLIITMVSTDWVAIYNGVLEIRESENGLLHLTGTEEGAAVIWETQTDNIPIGIIVQNNPTEGTASEPASTLVTVTHKANMRGMYHFQLLSLENGEETVIASGTSHAHNFYGSITKETIAGAIAKFVNNQEGYTAEYNEGENTFVMKADTAKEGQTLAIRMIENKAEIVYDQDTMAADAVKEAIEAIGTVTEQSGDAIKNARDAYNALTETQKSLISDELKNTLEDAETAYEALVSQAAAKAVEDKINAIGTVTKQSGNAIKEARDAYNSLSDAQKDMVSDTAKKTLEDAEKTYNDLTKETSSGAGSGGSSSGKNINQAAAKAVEDKINAIGTVTEQSADAIKNARDAYDALTEAQKALVSDTAKKTLSDAEAAFEALKHVSPPDDQDTNPYKDVNADSWYFDNVMNVTKKGIFQGSGDGFFNPEKDMTRAEFAQVLYNMEQKPAITQNSVFTDVDNGSWYADAVNWAASTECGNGDMLINGYPDGKFQPDASITREQMVTLMYRYAQYKKSDTSKRDSLSGFTDRETVQDYALNAVQWAVAEGLIKGMTDTTLEPSGNTTRAQVAAVLDRFTDLVQ